MTHAYQRLVENLLLTENASRVTLRLEDPTGGLPVVAEAVKDGAEKIGETATADVRSVPAVAQLAQTRELLIQNDIEASDPPMPEDLRRLYELKAQMLAPLTRDGRLVGIISVHD